MPKRSLVLHPLLLLLFTIALTGCSVTHVMRVQDRETIEVKSMMDELQDTPLVFAGERHDAPSHHRLQLDILKALQAGGKQLAIGMEMFERSSQPALDAWSAGKVPEYALRKVYEGNWRNISWGLYEEILLFARDNRIPLVALNAPKSVIRKVFRTGYASLSDQELKQLPPGVDAALTEEYLGFMASFYPSHGKNGDGFRYLCEAQMLRNRFMAQRIVDYLEKNPGRIMVVIAGGGHVRGIGGVPAEVKQIPYKILLPPLGRLNAGSVTTEDGDYLMEEPLSWLGEIL